MKKIYEYESFQQYKDENKSTFENHKASYQKLEIGNDCIITFEDPACSNGAMKFVYVDGVLTVQGDYGTASFNWHNRNNHILAYGSFNSFGYVLSKLESVKDDELYGWSEDLFSKEWGEFIQERFEYGYGIDTDMAELPYGIHGMHSVIQFFQDHYDDYGDDLFDTNAYTLGRYVAERPYLWWFGLQTALEILVKDGKLNAN